MNSIDLGYAMGQLRRALACNRLDSAQDCVQRAIDALERAGDVEEPCQELYLDGCGEPIPADEYAGESL